MTLNKQFLDSYIQDHPDSALFPMHAEQLLQENSLDEATEVCEAGLEQFPHLATGWLIYGKIALVQEQYEEAKSRLLKSLDADRACLGASELLLTEILVELTAGETSELHSILSDMGIEVKTVSEEETREDKANKILAEPKPDLVEESDDVESEDQGAAVSASENEADTLDQAFQEAMEEDKFTPPEFEGDLLDESDTGELEEEFNLEELEAEADEEEEEFIDKKEGASDDELKRDNVDFAEMISKESEKAPESAKELQLSREQLEAMSQQELLEFLKMKYDLEEEAESSAAFLRRLAEIEDLDPDVHDALGRFDIFKIEDDTRETSEESPQEETEISTEEEIEEKQIEVEPEQVTDESPEPVTTDELSEEIEEIEAEAEFKPEDATTDSDEKQDTGEKEDSAVEVPLEEPEEIPEVKPKSRPSNEAKLTITPRMATFTFADVLRKQGLYEQAYEVLEMMRDKSPNIERIEREQEKLKKLMNPSDSKNS